jgi:hypothetical protein
MTPPPSSARLGQLVDRFAVATSRIEKLQDEIAGWSGERVDIVMEFRGMGYRNFEIAEILGVSPQRISQLVQIRRHALLEQEE